MEWINEMFSTMEKDRAAESVEKGQKNARKNAQAKHPAKQAPGAPDVWNTLVSSIENDVNAFNSHEKRATQTKVSMHHSHSQCQVYLSGMHSKRLVLTLDNNDLRVSVHPDFPAQQVTITIEPDLDGRHAFWVLGEPGKEGAKLSVQDLSQYLLKPILCSAAIDREL
jgi:hypothetical protein